MADRYNYWHQLMLANRDFRKTRSYASVDKEKSEFQKWMLDEWGMEIGLETQGYTGNFSVIDEKKYLLFKIKYSEDQI